MSIGLWRFDYSIVMRVTCFITRAGVFPVILGMGIDTFSIALYERRDFVEQLLDIYFDWSIAVARTVCSLSSVFLETSI